MLYDELVEMVRELGMEGKLTKEMLIKIVEETVQKVNKEEYAINENTVENRIEKAIKEGKEQLAQNISKVYEYQLLFDHSIGSMCAVMELGGTRIDVFFNKMDIHIVKDTLEIELRKDEEPVGMLVVTKDNKVNFDKEEWILKVA